MPSNPTEPTLQVEMLLYSGEDNPIWKITGKDLLPVENALCGLVPSDNKIPSPHTGFAGFRLTVLSGLEHLPQTLRIEKKIAWVKVGDLTSVFDDAGNALQLLIDSAHKNGFGDLL
jgi:hypothetical protein